MLCRRVNGRSRGQRPVLFLLFFVFFFGAFFGGCQCCGPIRGANRRRSPRKLTPLVYKQHEPNVPETSITASGPGRMINRNDPGFENLVKDLVPNYNDDVIFRDEEGTAEDRLMTSRCKEKLDALAISVLNQWPGVRLRVTEAFDEEGFHALASLHYEGRAVDLTTSDKDRSKYGMLARLARDAGFDWVYYESRAHVHASVKSESVENRAGGCFHGNTLVHTSNKGTVKMSELNVNDRVLAFNSEGDLTYSEVVMWLDRDEFETRLYHTIETENGANITVTPVHLIYTKRTNSSSPDVVFAREIKPGNYIYVVETFPENLRSRKVIFDKVTRITVTTEIGVFAPLTNEGTIVVNNVVASCYAVFKQQTLAHLAFYPVRILYSFKISLLQILNRLHLTRSTPQTRSGTPGDVESIKGGIHWYPRMLYKLGQYTLPQRFLYH